MGLAADLFTVAQIGISGRDLILIGMALVGEGIDMHIPKGYIYFAMAFSVGVEMLNIRMRKRLEPVKLRKRIEEE